MDHRDYFRYVEASTPDDVHAYVMDALRNLLEEWQGYDVSFSQYGLAKMLIDLGHARLSTCGTVVAQTTAGHTVFFTKAFPYIGFSKTSEESVPHYAMIVPAGIVIDNTVYNIK